MFISNSFLPVMHGMPHLHSGTNTKFLIVCYRVYNRTIRNSNL
ncbi:hypothetical protein BACPEC_03055 [[Bacteroides] pectinophilus ATCC 43243]|uniref:Uncharacterized protein n=1 Tax=[Bacteroides] pectinophilus ATCC 43243 TaxID=483218 RepID=B7AWF4_9FIRM|nr:hypothetical protein BACPEC_03055 [[Bacteroides] pectinophilus ATCC 43243]